MLGSIVRRRRAAGGRELSSLATISLLVIGLAAAPAAAKDRYVAPGGGGTECTELTPCPLEAGVNEAVAGEVVHVPGDLGVYEVSGTSITAVGGVSVIGEGAQMPRIRIHGENAVFVNPGASLEGVDLSRASGKPVLLFALGTVSASRVESSTGLPLELYGLLRDSFVRATGPTTPAVLAAGPAPALRNVTVVAEGAEASGLVTMNIAVKMSECEPRSVELRNTIARGPKSDLEAVGSGCPAIIDAGFSNYRGGAVSVSGESGAFVDKGGNQTGVEPLLAADGYHQVAGSPTIDAGIATPENGGIDIDGEPRAQGAGPDIGADEAFSPPLPVPPSDTTAPVGSKLSVKPRRFRPKRKRAPSVATTSAKKRGKRSRRTSRVSYRLSEDARVRFIVRRRVIGRKKGKRCVIGKRARRLPKAKKCRKLVRMRGAFTHAGTQGANGFRFSGYLRGRRLRPGTYRMIGVPTDTAGNRGRRFGASFVIARR